MASSQTQTVMIQYNHNFNEGLILALLKRVLRSLKLNSNSFLSLNHKFTKFTKALA
jgi:hypothetical protein